MKQKGEKQTKSKNIKRLLLHSLAVLACTGCKMDMSLGSRTKLAAEESAAQGEEAPTPQRERQKIRMALRGALPPWASVEWGTPVNFNVQEGSQAAVGSYRGGRITPLNNGFYAVQGSITFPASNASASSEPGTCQVFVYVYGLPIPVFVASEVWAPGQRCELSFSTVLGLHAGQDIMIATMATGNPQPAAAGTNLRYGSVYVEELP